MKDRIDQYEEWQIEQAIMAIFSLQYKSYATEKTFLPIWCLRIIRIF
ncbi:hypothetical protein [Spirochaeta cellobiosiphila]|nr:hypothetical protein [Spirochaeta cellobiosiphila]